MTRCEICGKDDVSLYHVRHKDLGVVKLCPDCWRDAYAKNLLVSGNLEGIRRYYSERGYAQDPLLEMKEENQVASFAKPIPSESGQSRHHIKVKETRKYYVIDSHVDRYDLKKTR
jgi:hypothetical protein